MPRTAQRTARSNGLIVNQFPVTVLAITAILFFSLRLDLLDGETHGFFSNFALYLLVLIAPFYTLVFLFFVLIKFDDEKILVFKNLSFKVILMNDIVKYEPTYFGNAGINSRIRAVKLHLIDGSSYFIDTRSFGLADVQKLNTHLLKNAARTRRY